LPQRASLVATCTSLGQTAIAVDLSECGRGICSATAREPSRL
jgi:hypothetical protein